MYFFQKPQVPKHKLETFNVAEIVSEVYFESCNKFVVYFP